MRIAIDIDGTINQAFFYDRIHGEIICKEFNHEYIYDPSDIHVKQQFQMDEELYNEYMRRYFPWNVKENKLLPLAAEVIRKLKRSGHEVFIMTARDPEFNKEYQPYKGEIMVHDTGIWLLKNNILIHKNNVLFGVKNKGEKCEELEIDLLVDDDPKNIRTGLEHNIYVAMPVYPYNKDLIEQGQPRLVPLHNYWFSFLQRFPCLFE